MVKFMLLVSELWLSPAQRVILLCLRFPVFHKERLLFKLCSAADVCIMRLLLSEKKNKAVRKRVAVHVSHLEIALFDFTEWDSPLFTFLYLSLLYWPIYIYAGESCKSARVCVCVFLYFMLMERSWGQGDRFRGQHGVLGGIPAGVMCLKSITPTARISVCGRVCVCVCVSPKDAITMVIQKPVD